MQYLLSLLLAIGTLLYSPRDIFAQLPTADTTSLDFPLVNLPPQMRWIRIWGGDDERRPPIIAIGAEVAELQIDERRVDVAQDADLARFAGDGLIGAGAGHVGDAYLDTLARCQTGFDACPQVCGARLWLAKPSGPAAS